MACCPYLIINDELEELADPQPDTLVLCFCQGYEMREDILHASHLASVGEGTVRCDAQK